MGKAGHMAVGKLGNVQARFANAKIQQGPFP